MLRGLQLSQGHKSWLTFQVPVQRGVTSRAPCPRSPQ